MSTSVTCATSKRWWSASNFRVDDVLEPLEEQTTDKEGEDSDEEIRDSSDGNTGFFDGKMSMLDLNLAQGAFSYLNSLKLEGLTWMLFFPDNFISNLNQSILNPDHEYLNLDLHPRSCFNYPLLTSHKRLWKKSSWDMVERTCSGDVPILWGGCHDNNCRNNEKHWSANPRRTVLWRARVSKRMRRTTNWWAGFSFSCYSWSLASSRRV